jgi:radical SAM superfamily enzyme YgiQ (UPF0313 family)
MLREARKGGAMSTIRRVLLVYTDPYYLVKQVYPYGLDLLATRLRQDGVDTRIEYAFLPGKQALTNLSRIFAEYRPELIGLGIRNLDTCMACEDYGDLSGDGYRSFFFLPPIREVADAVRKLGPEVPMVCGGGGFTIEPQGILEYLDVDYGIVGEGEEALAAFVQQWPDHSRLQDIPGMVMSTAAGFKKTPRKPFTFPNLDAAQRDQGFHHAFASAGLPVRVKRGCNQSCVFCVEPIIEGSSFVYRDPVEVIGELQEHAALDQVNKIFFVDTEFNIPDLTYATQLLEYVLAAGLNSRYRFVSQFLPRPFTDAFAALLAKVGMSVIMTVTSFADPVLRASGTSYRQADIVNAIELCARHDIDITIDLIFGLPGETWETVVQTIKAMNDFPANGRRHYEYTVGARIYPGTGLAKMVQTPGQEQHLYGRVTPSLLEPCFFCTPAPPLELKGFIDARLPSPMRFDNELSDTLRARLAVAYLADRGHFDDAYRTYQSLALPDKSLAFDYFFRQSANHGRLETARLAAENLKHAISEANDPVYYGQIGVIDYYLDILN